MPLLVQAPPGPVSGRAAAVFSAPSTGITCSEVTAGSSSHCLRRVRGCHISARPWPAPDPRGSSWLVRVVAGCGRAGDPGALGRDPRGDPPRMCCGSCASCAFGGVGPRALAAACLTRLPSLAGWYTPPKEDG